MDNGLTWSLCLKLVVHWKKQNISLSPKSLLNADFNKLQVILIFTHLKAEK